LSVWWFTVQRYWSIYELLSGYLSKRYGNLRLTVQMKNLTVEHLTEWHIEAASSILSVVNNNNPLEHVVMEPFRHAIKRPHITIQSTDNIKVASCTKVCGES